MTRVAVDFSQVEEFEPIENGNYLCEITNVEYRDTEVEDKYPYLNVEYTVREDGEFQGQKTWGIWSLSPKALWRMKQDWENLGILAEDQEIDIDYDEDTNVVTEPELIGLQAIVTIKQESYEGRTTSRAQAVVGDDAPAPKEEKRSTKAAPKEKAAAGKSTGKTTTRRKFQ